MDSYCWSSRCKYWLIWGNRKSLPLKTSIWQRTRNKGCWRCWILWLGLFSS